MLPPKLLKLKPCRYDLQVSCQVATLVAKLQRLNWQRNPPQAIYEQEFELVDEAQEGQTASHIERLQYLEDHPRACKWIVTIVSKSPK